MMTIQEDTDVGIKKNINNTSDDDYDIQKAVQTMIENESKENLLSLRRKLAVVPNELKRHHIKRKKKNKISKKARRKNR
jgi:hypothetical protein